LLARLELWLAAGLCVDVSEPDAGAGVACAGVETDVASTRVVAAAPVEV
jgi:hypothetical protein